jgi:uncharacterized protein (TIGR03435 family)
MKRHIIAGMAAVLTIHVEAQQPATTRFEVLSIKPTRSEEARVGFRTTPGGRFEWTNVPVGTLIGIAHSRFVFDNFETIGVPAWVDRERFDVIAQTAAGTAAPGLSSEITAMLRAMLADRFKLITHWEQRERAVYALVVARPGARLGQGLHRVDVGCEGTQAMTGGGRGSMRPGRGPNCTFGGGPGNVQANAVTLQAFGSMIGASELRRPVIDRTGLSGNFDIDLRYRPDLGTRPDGPPQAPADPDAPSIFTAVDEQLGLKLVSDRDPVDVLVIDRLERPTPD